MAKPLEHYTNVTGHHNPKEKYMATVTLQYKVEGKDKDEARREAERKVLGDKIGNLDEYVSILINKTK